MGKVSQTRLVRVVAIQTPEEGPVWNAGISQESHRNFIGISSISQKKRRNGEKIPHSKPALRNSALLHVIGDKRKRKG